MWCYRIVAWTKLVLSPAILFFVTNTFLLPNFVCSSSAFLGSMAAWNHNGALASRWLCVCVCVRVCARAYTHVCLLVIWCNVGERPMLSLAASYEWCMIWLKISLLEHLLPFCFIKSPCAPVTTCTCCWVYRTS